MFDDPEILEKTGKAAEGTIFTTWSFAPNSPDPHVQALLAEYSRTYDGKTPGMFVPESYDAAALLLEANKHVGYDSSRIADYLYRLREFQEHTAPTQPK